MKRLIAKHKKTFIISSLLILCLSIYPVLLSVRSNFDVLLDMSLSHFLADISHTTSDFSNYGEVVIKDVRMKDKDGLTTVYTPKLTLKYSIKDILRGRISEINVDNPYVYISIDKERKLNILEVFRKEKKKKSNKKSGTSIPIDILTVTNASLSLQDNYYNEPISHFLAGVEGYVSFDRKNGLDLRFYSIEKKEKIEYSYTNYGVGKSMVIKIEDKEIDQNLMQYAYAGSYIEYLGGRINLDLTIDNNGLWGEANIFGAKLQTKVYDGVATDVNGKANFLGRRIGLKLDGKINGHNLKYQMDYNSDGIEMYMALRNLKKEDIKKTPLLDDTFKGKLDGLGDFNINYFKLGLFWDREFNLTLDNYISLDNLEIRGLELEDIKGNITMEEGDLRLKDVRFFVKDDKNIGYVLLNGGYKDKVLDLNYSLLNKGSSFNIEELNGDIVYNLDDDKIDYSLDSNILKVGGYIDLSKSILEVSSIGTKELEVKYQEKEYSTENTIKIIYDYKKRELLYGKGDLSIIEKDSSNYLDLNFSNQGNIVYLNEIDINYKELRLKGSGFFNIEDLSYEFSYQGENFEIENFDFLEGIEAKANFEGKLTGKKKKYNIVLDLESKFGKYEVEYEDFAGRLRIMNQEGVGVSFDGYVGNLSYKGIRFSDFKIGIDYKDNVLSIREARNNLLTITGDYNIIKETLDFSYKITGVKEDKVKNLEDYEIKMELVEVEGTIKGGLNSLESEIYSEDAWIQYKNFPKINLKGGLKLLGNKIYFEGFKVDENRISGYYLINDKSFELKVNLLENNLPDYYGDINLKYRLTGEAILWGTSKNIDGIFHLYADNVYLRGEKLPNIRMTSTYRGGNAERVEETGRVDVNDIILSNDIGEELIGGSGWVDLKNKELSFKIEDKIEIKKLKNYLGEEEISGELETEINVFGGLEDPKYTIKVESEVIKVRNNDLEELNISLEGTLKEVIANNISLSYHGNRLMSKGNIDLEALKYDFIIKSNLIDLSFLNAFEISEYSKEIEGMGVIDVKLSSESNYGELFIKNFSVKIPEYGINIDKVNTKIALEKKNIQIEYFDGLINDGKVRMDGHLNLPSVEEIAAEQNKLYNLDYEFNLNLDKMNYNYQDKVELILSSDAVFTKNKVTGEFIINSGIIKGIPEFSSKEISKFASQIKEKEVIESSKELGADFEIKGTIENSKNIDLDIAIKTENLVKLRVRRLDYTSIVEDILGDLYFDGNIKVEDEEVSYNGIFELENGTIELNRNLFYLSTVTAKFMKGVTEPLELRPSLVISGNSTIANEEVYINITGEYPDLAIQMSSGSGLSTDEIGSLLTFHNVSEESSTNAVVKDVLDREISGRIFSPISSEIAEVLRVEKFQISSDLVAYEYEGGVYKDTGTLRLGASIEAENPIYKDKIYWKANARWGTSEYYDNVLEYDFALENRITKNLSLGSGIGKIAEGRKTQGDSLINYHIDLNWRKKYKNLGQILLELLFIGGEE